MKTALFRHPNLIFFGSRIIILNKTGDFVRKIIAFNNINGLFLFKNRSNSSIFLQKCLFFGRNTKMASDKNRLQYQNWFVSDKKVIFVPKSTLSMSKIACFRQNDLFFGSKRILVSKMQQFRTFFRLKMNNLQTDVYEFLPSGKHFRKYFSKNGVEWISKQQCELCICSKLWIFSEFEELKRSLFSRITDVLDF